MIALLAIKRKEDVGVKEMLRKRSTTTKKSFLCLIVSNGGLLLRNRQGIWEAIGGSVGEHESPQQAATRQLYEKYGLVINGISLIGEIFMVFDKDPSSNEQIFVFKSSDFSVIRQNEETNWKKAEELDTLKMPEHYGLWLPKAINEQKFKCIFYFDSHERMHMLKYSIEAL